MGVNEGYNFVVNGRAVTAVTAVTDGDTPLLAVLRDQFGLRGAKFGCGTEQCGACMVLIDGKPEYSCAKDMATVTGRDIITVEGLATVGTLSPLQQALLDEQAGQCGYCLAGILISATALLAKNPKPSRDEIVAALDPHLCRCGMHNRVIRAVQRAGAAFASASMAGRQP